MTNLFIILILVTFLGYFLGKYISLIFTNKINFLSKLENTIYKICGIKKIEEQTPICYFKCLIYFNLIGFVILFIILKLQNFDNIPAINSAISYVTNTNWQSFVPEQTVKIYGQMLGFAVQNFLSAATSIIVAIVIIRALIKQQTGLIGNFYQDIIRTNLYILLPICIISALISVYLGSPQNFISSLTYKTLEGQTDYIQMGPIASQIAIKLLGSNGGGYFNANSIHPFENPSYISNWFQIILVLLLPVSLAFTFGNLTKKHAHSLTTYTVMMALFIAGCFVIEKYENEPITPLSNIQNKEGKDLRIGMNGSDIYLNAITATSAGANNAAIESMTPISTMTLIVNLMLGGIIFGGAGCGIYSIIFNIIIALFLAGLMVGRSPEYFGKKIEEKEIKLVVIYMLLIPVVTLTFSSIALSYEDVIKATSVPGPHAITQILYAYLSAVTNNGSLMGGLNVSNNFYNITSSIAMLIGRFVPIYLVFKFAEVFAGKKTIPESSGTFPVYGLQFGCLLIGVIILVVALTFMPVLILGPLLEYFTLTGNLW